MIAIVIFLFVLLITFLICITAITLSDTETFKVIDRKIAEKIDKKGEK